MNKLEYTQKPEYIFDDMYPERHLDVTIDDEDSLFTLMFEIVQLARYASYVVTEKNWEKIGDYIAERGGFDEPIS